jgi:ribosome biogenesis GTPase
MSSSIKLEYLGFSDQLEKLMTGKDLTGFEAGRVIAEHKERYIVKTGEGEFEAEVTGNLRYTAKSREDFPAVGDWVALTIHDGDFAVIHHILPRHSIIRRQAVGKFGEVQVIAANIDVAFIVQASDRDFNINRLERYLTLCHSSGVRPVLLLTKIDLVSGSRLREILDQVGARIKDMPVMAVSNETKQGYEALSAFILKGKTYCLLGSSGVGKSTLLNNLSGNALMKTGQISRSTNKGRHVTSHRELIILQNGGILIDNPGMREVGIADTSGGLEMTFDTIITLSQGCRFRDCTHTGEAGCLVLEAVERGEIDRASYENYLKMEREKAHFESSVAEKRKKDKAFGKMVRNIKKDMKKQ